MQDAKSLLDLAKKMRDKHLADGETSPLKVLDWAVVGPLIDDALKTEEAADRLKREKVMTFQLREQRLQEVLSIVRNGRDILTAVHSNQMKALGQWGFDVLETRVTTPLDELPAAQKSA